MTRIWKGFQAHDRKYLVALKRLLVKVWMLKVTLARAWKKVKRKIENFSVILENTYIVMKRMLPGLTSIKYIGEVSD